MSETPSPEQQAPDLDLKVDPEVVAHSDGDEGEEGPCGNFDNSCGWNG